MKCAKSIVSTPLIVYFIYLTREHTIWGSPIPKETIKTPFLEKIGLVELRKLKYSSRTYYITIEPDVIASYGLLPGDLIKIKIIEARKDRERAKDEPKREEF